MTINGHRISTSRIAMSILAAMVTIGMAWALLAISEPVDRALIEVMK